MKIKKRVIPMLAGMVTAVMLTSTASAHDGDILGGKYIGKNGAHILLRINRSAQTSLLNYNDVYQYGFDWNDISSKVNVSIAYESSGMPVLYGQMNVNGCTDLGDTAGQTQYYDSNGNITSMNSDWAYVVITMNTNSSVYDGLPDKKFCARKVFVHEVGHALKLDHPEQNLLLPGHTNPAYGGYPYAIMNQNPPIKDYPFVSMTVTSHDKSCLIAKWGE